MKNEYFGYVRVSTQKQGEGASLEAQRDAITRYATQNNLTLTEWFCEKETAAKAGRPIFAQMIKALKKQKTAGFIVHKIDRSARNFKDWAMIGDLSDAGFDIHFATETLDFRSRGGRLAADIQAVIAADYIRNLREETIKGITGRLKQGLYPFKAPLGYLDNGGGKVKTVCPDIGPKVRQLFTTYATGSHSLYSLQAHATEIGLVTKYGNPLSLGFLGGMLGNPFYCGIIKIKKTGETYDGQHTALIPVSVFERVQEVKRGTHIKRCTQHQHLYRGLFACAHCSYAMIAEKQKDHVYYRCHTRSCPSNSIRQEIIEQDIIESLQQLELSHEAAQRLQRVAITWVDTKQQDGKTLSTAKRLRLLEQEMHTLTEAFLTKVIDADTYKQQKEVITLERRRVEEQATQGSETDKAADTLQKFLELAKSLVLLYDFMTDDEKREFLEITTSNRKVKEKKAYFEPRKWLEWVENDPMVLNGTHPPHNPRRPHTKVATIETILHAMLTPEAERFVSLCQHVCDRHDGKKPPEDRTARFKRVT